MFRWCVVLMIMGLASCASGSGMIESPVTIGGKVVMIGNDPFVSPALQMPDGTIYPLMAEGETLRTLCAAQGRWIRVHVDGSEPGPLGTGMRVQRVEILEQPSARE